MNILPRSASSITRNDIGRKAGRLEAARALVASGPVGWYRLRM